jgi:magnesium transporter
MGGGSRARRRARRTPPGTAPGTLRTVAEATAPVVRVLSFGPDGFEERALPDVAELAPLLRRRPVTWIDVAGVGNPETIARLGDTLGLHRLALEDVLHVDQRPKVEEYDDVLYVVARMLHPARSVEGEQLSLFLGRGFVATFQENATDGDCLDPVRARIRQAGPRLRASGPAYLAYAILDAVVDAYFPVVEKLGDRLESLEERLLERPDPGVLPELHTLRRDLAMLRRSIWPLRDVLGALLREGKNPFEAELRIYVRDCHDHAIRVLDLVETYRDIASGLLELYLSMSSHRLGEVTKVLTLVATIFIPLSFLAGLWGMNFDTSRPWNMPELSWPFGYAFALGVMAAVAGGMLLFFRRKGWL